MNLIKRRRNLLVISGSLAAIAALTYLSLPLDVAQASPQAAVLRLDVCVDPAADRIDVDPPVPPQLHPFHISGVIFDRGGTTPIGTYRCWGWRNPGEVSVINQVYSIDGRGSIQTQGLESFVATTPQHAAPDVQPRAQRRAVEQPEAVPAEDIPAEALHRK